jgi:hypothetical protein
MPVQQTVHPLHRHGFRSDQAETVRILHGGFRGSYYSGDGRDQLDHVDWIHDYHFLPCQARLAHDW